MNTSIQTRVPRGVEVRELTPDEVQKYHRMYFTQEWRDTQPMPAEAPTEVGADLDPARGIVIAIPVALLAWAGIAACAVAAKFWFF
jgi:hypothetical protein